MRIRNTWNCSDAELWRRVALAAKIADRKRKKRNAKARKSNAEYRKRKKAVDPMWRRVQKPKKRGRPKIFTDQEVKERAEFRNRAWRSSPAGRAYYKDKSKQKRADPVKRKAENKRAATRRRERWATDKKYREGELKRNRPRAARHKLLNSMLRVGLKIERKLK